MIVRRTQLAGLGDEARRERERKAQQLGPRHAAPLPAHPELSDRAVGGAIGPAVQRVVLSERPPQRRRQPRRPQPRPAVQAVRPPAGDGDPAAQHRPAVPRAEQRDAARDLEAGVQPEAPAPQPDGRRGPAARPSPLLDGRPGSPQRRGDGGSVIGPRAAAGRGHVPLVRRARSGSGRRPGDEQRHPPAHDETGYS